MQIAKSLNEMKHLLNLIFKNKRMAQRTPDSQTFVLLITLYEEKNSLRREELMTCLDKNLQHPLIDKVIIFFEKKENTPGTFYKQISMMKNNLEIIICKERPTFKSFFEFANDQLKGKNVILANADIFFDSTLNEIKDYDFTNKFFVLTRWNVVDNNQLYLQSWKNPVYPWEKIKKEELIKNPNLQNAHSADAWIFRAPVDLDFECEFPLGTYMCDSLLNFSLLGKQAQGAFRVFNPCLSIRACHLDKNINQKDRASYLRYKKENYSTELLGRVGKGRVKWCYLNDTL